MNNEAQEKKSIASLASVPTAHPPHPTEELMAGSPH